jgi:hypothetical protein
MNNRNIVSNNALHNQGSRTGASANPSGHVSTINQDLPISNNDRGRGSAVNLTQKLTAFASGRPSNAREMGSNTSTPAVDESASVGSVRGSPHKKLKGEHNKAPQSAGLDGLNPN